MNVRSGMKGFVGFLSRIRRASDLLRIGFDSRRLHQRIDSFGFDTHQWYQPYRA